MPTDRRVVVERSRTIQVHGAYTAESHLIREEATLAHGEAADAWELAAATRLDAQLDAWDRKVRAEAKPAATPAPAPGPAVPAPVGPPPSKDILSDLRAAAVELGNLTKEPVQLPPPKTQAEAEATLKQLRGAIYDAKRGAR